jgi:hypothetical protein
MLEMLSVINPTLLAKHSKCLSSDIPEMVGVSSSLSFPLGIGEHGH